MVERLKRRILFSRPARRTIGWAKRVVLPGFEGFNLYQVSRFFFAALSEGHLVTRASAIAFKLFMAFFPGVIMLLTLIPYVPVPDFQAQLLGTFHDMMPAEVYGFIEGTLHDLVVKKHGTLLSVSFLVGIYLASNTIDAILAGFSGSTNLTAWHTPLKQRLLSLGLLVALSVLMIVAIPVMTLGGAAIGWLNQLGLVNSGLEVIALIALKWLMSILLVVLFVSLLYNAGDPVSRRFKLISPGVLLAVFLILLVSQGLAYAFGHFTNYNALYGSIGAILAVQLWIYVNMIVLLVGYELNTSIIRARLHHSTRLEVPPEPAS